MSGFAERIELIIREKLTRQAQTDDVLIYDAPSGMVDGVIDVHRLAGALVLALLPDRVA